MRMLFAAALVLSVAPATRPAPPTAVLVELFTSEGCSSCPPADALLAKLAAEGTIGDAIVVPLEFHVDYWDRLGWKDPFSSAAFTKRQQEYGAVFAADDIYTPQMVVAGRHQFVGSDEAAARAALAKAAADPALAITASARVRGSALRMTIDLPAAPAGSEPIDVVTALTEDDLTSAVRRGENSGRTLRHVAVVRRLQTSGQLDADAFVAEGQWPLDARWSRDRLHVVVWLQGRKSKRVYGAVRTSIAD